MIKTRMILTLLSVFLLSAPMAYAQSAFDDPGASVATGGSGGLVPVEAKVVAGNIAPGTTNTMIVQFKNESGADIEFQDMKLFPSSNVTAQLSSDQCSSEPLQSGAVCAVVMDVKGLQAGAFRVEILARHTGRSRLVTASVSGAVDAQGEGVTKTSDVEITPAVIEFGKLDASRPIIRSVTLRNITSEEITINDMFIDTPEGSGFSLKTDCKNLMAGASCIASIVWSPVTKGPTSGSLVVQHTGPTGVATANMTGDFAPTTAAAANRFPEAVPGKGLLIASEESINFGSDIQSQSSITVSLVNTGDAALTLSKIELSGSDQGLKLVQSGCVEGLALQATEACPLTISWTPSKAGAVIDDVQITHTGARGILVLPVRGTSSGSVNVDSQPVVSVVETVEDGKTIVTTPKNDNGNRSPGLDGYVVTSISRKNAIISGPGGSRMVRDGQKIRLAGSQWAVSITDEGVSMLSQKNRVLLVFDRSLAAPASGGSSAASTPSADTPAQAAAPVPSPAASTPAAVQ
jgi:hypothetical protein